MRRGMADVKWIDVQKRGFQKRERKRRKGKDIQAKVVVRLIGLGRLRLNPRLLIEM